MEITIVHLIVAVFINAVITFICFAVVNSKANDNFDYCQRLNSISIDTLDKLLKQNKIVTSVIDSIWNINVIQKKTIDLIKWVEPNAKPEQPKKRGRPRKVENGI